MLKRPAATRIVAPTKSASRDYLLQRYVQLSTQQNSMHQRLSTSPPSPTLSPILDDSPSSSPTRTMNMFTHPSNYHNTTSTYLSSSQPVQPLPMPTTAYDGVLSQKDEPDRLCGITSQIKATLTELLNHESVKCDEKFRHWVQDRLLDVELELKSQRRRNRRKSSVDREVLNNIASSIKGDAYSGHGTTL